MRWPHTLSAEIMLANSTFITLLCDVLLQYLCHTLLANSVEKCVLPNLRRESCQQNDKTNFSKYMKTIFDTLIR